MTNLGPDLWNWSAIADAASPCEDLQASLQTLRATVAAWPAQVFSNQGKWQSRIDGELALIDAAAAACPVSDVFPTKSGAAAYQSALTAYQALKNDLDLSGDTLRDASGEGSVNEPAGFLGQLEGIVKKVGGFVAASGLGDLLARLGLGVLAVGVLVLGVVVWFLWSHREAIDRGISRLFENTVASL